MLNIKFCILKNGNIVGFRIIGHCGYDISGKDIVCAAVSSAVYMLINTFTDVLNVIPEILDIEEGHLELIVNENDEFQCRTLFSGLKIHLLGLE